MEALEMGKYGFFVWTCFGATFGVVLLVDIMARMKHKRVYRDIKVRVNAREGRQ